MPPGWRQGTGCKSSIWGSPMQQSGASLQQKDEVEHVTRGVKDIHMQLGNDSMHSTLLIIHYILMVCSDVLHDCTEQ